jgi:hypothetical protein
MEICSAIFDLLHKNRLMDAGILIGFQSGCEQAYEVKYISLLPNQAEAKHAKVTDPAGSIHKEKILANAPQLLFYLYILQLVINSFLP